jgi:hypothetical protein
MLTDRTTTEGRAAAEARPQTDPLREALERLAREAPTERLRRWAGRFLQGNEARQDGESKGEESGG